LKGIGVTLVYQPWHCDEGGVDQRFGQARTPAFRRDQGRLDQAHTQPAMLLGDQQAGQPHLDQTLPDRGIAVALLASSRRSTSGPWVPER
jgi:hypothetical protein